MRHKVHVWVCGDYSGAYEFATREEAETDMKEREKFRVLGCYYEIESPNVGPVYNPETGEYVLTRTATK